MNHLLNIWDAQTAAARWLFAAELLTLAALAVGIWQNLGRRRQPAAGPARAPLTRDEQRAALAGYPRGGIDLVDPWAASRADLNAAGVPGWVTSSVPLTVETTERVRAGLTPDGHTDIGTRYDRLDAAGWTPGTDGTGLPNIITTDTAGNRYINGRADIAPDGQGATADWSPRTTADAVGQSPDMTDEALARVREIEATVRAEVVARLDTPPPPFVWPSDDEIDEARGQAEWLALDQRLDEISRYHRLRLVESMRALPNIGGDTGAYELVTTFAAAARADAAAHGRAVDAVTSGEHRIPDADELAAMVEATGLHLEPWQREVLAGTGQDRRAFVYAGRKMGRTWPAGLTSAYTAAAEAEIAAVFGVPMHLIDRTHPVSDRPGPGPGGRQETPAQRRRRIHKTNRAAARAAQPDRGVQP